MASTKAVVLHIREIDGNKIKSRCLGRVPYNGVADLEGFRAFLESFKEKPIVPWPFDFWDSQLSMRIATVLEQINTLEFHGHVVTVIRSNGGHFMDREREESMAITEPTKKKKKSSSDFQRQLNPITEPTKKKKKSSSDFQRQLNPITEPNTDAFPLIPSLPLLSSREEDLQEVASYPKLVPKHKIFLSHSGAQKSFVAKLCKTLEAHNQFPFFDQRDDSLPKGKKFSTLILDAANRCQVAVVVLSEEYLSSKWPMLELVEFVRARRSENKNLNLLPLFYKASVDDLSDKSIRVKWKPRWVKVVAGDSRVDLEEWAKAVREIRGVNGLSFDKFGNSKESYRDSIVEKIFLLAPPDLLYDTSKIFGRDRICEILANMFLPDTKTSAHVLGLYGMGGLGKTTMSKSLCNHFNKKFLGRVCYMEIKEGMNALERQQLVMRKLLRLDKLLLQNICDVDEGWELLQSRMKECPVFLVIDNVQPDHLSKEEVLKYLNIRYNSDSKIMVISRSLDVVQDLLGGSHYCHEIPSLTLEEAAGVFLQQGAPLMNYSSLTTDESRVVKSCLGEAWFSQQLHVQSYFRGKEPLRQNEAGHYHPLTLRALGAYIHDRSKSYNVLSWRTYLHEYGKLKGTGESSRQYIFSILGLQFKTLDSITQLMFLDTSLYAAKALQTPMLSNSPLEDLIAWLTNIHEVAIEVVRSKIFDLKRFAMINIEGEDIIVHDLYKEYATWFLGQAKGDKVLGFWCVGKGGHLDSSLPPELQRKPSGTCWPNLKRIRLEDSRCIDFPVVKIQEWCNVIVLEIVACYNLIELNLQGLTCLRHLELKFLVSLKTLTFTGYGGSSTSNVSQGTFTEPRQYLLPPLQFVTIVGLSSLECLPSFSPFTSLKFLKILDCNGLVQPPTFKRCSGLERMWLSWHQNQISLPSLDGLTSLRDLTIKCDALCKLYHGGLTTLKLEGLSSLISLRALELENIPVGDLADLQNLARVEYISLLAMRHLTSFLPLVNLARSSLRVLEVRDYDNRFTNAREDVRLEGLDELKVLIKLKLERLAARGEIVPYTPSKIKAPMDKECLWKIRNTRKLLRGLRVACSVIVGVQKWRRRSVGKKC